MNSISFTLEPESKIKLYYQLYEKISELIKDGTYKPNSKIPSIRTISNKLDVSKNTVAKAYELLEKNHFIYSEQKRGYFVMDLTQSESIESETENPDEDKNDDMGIPTVEAILKKRQEENESQSPTSTPEPPKASSIDEDELKQLEDLSKSFVEKQSKTVTTESNAEKVVTDEIDKKETVTIDSVLEEKQEPEKSVTFDKEADSLSEEKTVTIKSVPEKNDIEKKVTEESTNKSIEEKFSECCSRVFVKSSASENQNEEQKFKKVLAEFLSEFLNIPCNEEQIIVSASQDLLLSSIIHLQSLNTPYIKSNGVGLLKLANQFTNGSLTTVKPIAAIPEDTDSVTKKIFSNANLPTQLTPLGEFGMDPDFLITSGATSAFIIPRDIPDFVVEEPRDHIQTILDWANQASYRYIIEYEMESALDSQKILLKSFDKNEKVIYINSFENLLPFNLKTSFAILPKNIYADYKQKYDYFNSLASLLEQKILTDFIEKGYLKDYLWPNEK